MEGFSNVYSNQALESPELLTTPVYLLKIVSVKHDYY